MIFSDKNILIVGLGIGSMYERIIRESDLCNVFTLDTNPDKLPDFVSTEQVKEFCADSKMKFDLIIVSVPNYLHEPIVDDLAECGKLFLVDKPGFQTADRWRKKLESARIVMVKNNIYRDEVLGLKNLPPDQITISWTNKNRVPFPGSWFTTKEMSFGGVSRDLMPHLLSVYLFIYGSDTNPISQEKIRIFTLEQIDSTDYGIVDKNGIYDVDDHCRIEFPKGILQCCWKNRFESDDFGIYFKNGPIKMGLCPEYAYLRMIKEMLIISDEKYHWHNEIDLKIHSILDKL
jgi:predicted dehydrogenase